jgi:hypothetical protein
VHDDAAAAEYVFTAHELQLVDAAAQEYLPATQVTHWVPPVVSLKLPAAQPQFTQMYAASAVVSQKAKPHHCPLSSSSTQIEHMSALTSSRVTLIQS